jgi:hypothetical protein
VDWIYVLGKYPQIHFIIIKSTHTVYLLKSRYDSHSHSLSDAPAEGHSHEIFPGQDYSNPRVKDFINGIIIIFV